MLRSQPGRYTFPFAELPAQNSLTVSIVQAVGCFSFQAFRYQWFFNHLAYRRAVSVRRAVAHDEHSTWCGRSHLREQSEDYASTRGGATCVPHRAGLLQSGLRFGQNLTQRQRDCCREVGALVGKLNATDPDDQRKEGQQDIEGKLERPSIGEHAGHIEVTGHED
jgi:hypothetical protein